MQTQKGTSDLRQHLTFRVAGEEYAVGIMQVREILQYGTVTKVPGTPPSVRGVLNLRGSVIPVIDLAVKFGLPESVVTKRSCVVIVEVTLEAEKTVMGLMVDAVSQVMDLDQNQIQPPPAFGTQVKIDYLTGMGESGNKFVLLLDLERALTVNELKAAELAEAEAAAAAEGQAVPPPVEPAAPQAGATP
jgi:purine-binding chemotaxis protein CheW